MKKTWKQRAADVLLDSTRLGLWPVRVRDGIAIGARWTLYPWSSYWRGGFETELQAAMLGLGNLTGWTCWDLGAHYGLYTVGLGRRVGPTGQIVSFEPNPLSYRRLVRHCRMNRLDWVRTYECAVSDAPGDAEFYTYGDLRSTSPHLPYETETRTEECAPIPVRLVQLDELVAHGEIRLPNFIKVDVEGHAHKALAGARRSLASARPILIVAFHSQVEREGVRALLDPLGYTATPVTGPSKDHSGEDQDLLFRPRSARG